MNPLDTLGPLDRPLHLTTFTDAAASRAHREAVSLRDLLLRLLPGIKDIKRAAEKVASDYHGDWSRLLDLVHASIVVDSLDEVVQALRHGGLRLARVPKDRFTNPTAAGYRDLMLNVTMPNGVVGELQVHEGDAGREGRGTHPL